ncbi:PREDICTED: neuropeptide FF receptor 2-like [Priapulus caudatus]|uniref:Neuropeptide FF receptor 2-like n=1 Tax=Priapulus caudatus TaxID=37621 RepID=A0ABM1E8T5_PRICU|nr:PREDICTED: neuropeptide FF receptor 2-like [Priapulus caudatus]
MATDARSDVGGVVMWTLASVYVLIAVLIIITNICTIGAVVVCRRLHQPVNYYIASISAANFLMVFAVVPVVTIMVRGAAVYVANAPLLCDMRVVHQLAGDLVMVHSVYMMVVIAVDRYDAVLHPEKPAFTAARCALVVAATWAVAMLYALPTLALMTARKHDEYRSNATISYCYLTAGELAAKYYTDLAIGYVIPLALTAVLYGRIVCQLRAQRRRTPRGTAEVCWKKRSIKMAVAILALFATCWLPIHVILLTSLARDVRPELLLAVRHLATILVFCNSWIYVVIYAYYNADFRLAVTSLVFGDWRRCCRRQESRAGSASNLNNLSVVASAQRLSNMDLAS